MKIFIGWDPREAAAFAVARSTLRHHLNLPIPIYGLVLADLIKRGLYTRPVEYRSQRRRSPGDVGRDFGRATIDRARQ